MNRREFNKRAAASVTAAVLGPLRSFTVAAAGGGKAGRRPNVIYILADDLGYGDLSIMGQKKLQTPELYNLKDDLGEQDNLAAERPDVVERLEKLMQQAHRPAELAKAAQWGGAE